MSGILGDSSVSHNMNGNYSVVFRCQICWSQVQGEFPLMTGTLTRLARKLASAGTSDRGAFMYTLQHGSLRVVSICKLHSKLTAQERMFQENQMETARCFKTQT